MELKTVYAFYVSVGWAFMSNFNPKSYLYSSMWGPSFSPYAATMHPWNKEALKSMRKELGRVNMDVLMIKKLEKADVPSPDNKGFLSHEQLQVVESKMTPAEKMNKVIDYLLEKEDIYFEYFCQILEQSAFEGKSKMLRDKAKECKKYFGKCEYKQHTFMYSNITKTSYM